MIFANPIFLWGLLALAIPIAVHLFNFRRYRKVYFSNVEWLREVQSEKHRVRQVRRWLLLLLRCLAILFLVLAFAQPTLPSKEGQMRSGATVVSVYIDNSFSMENGGSDGTLLETAKQKAREIAAAYQPGDRYQLLSNNLDGAEFHWLSRDEFLDAVDTLHIGPASRRLSEVMQRQADFMNHSGAANRHAYLVSDFQTSATDLSSFLIPDSTLDYMLVPLEGVATDNLTIDTITLDAPAYFVGGSVTVDATISNRGSHDIEKLPVKLSIGGRERALATLDIPSGASAKASLRFTIDSAGWLDGHVDITDYPVTFDDSYHFTLLAGQPIEMMQVGKANDNLEKLFAHDSSLRYQYSSLITHHSSLNFIIINELIALPSGDAQALASWVDEGGTLCVVPPADGDISQLNALLAMLQAPQLDKWSRQSVKASRVDYGSSLYRNVFSGRNDEMEMPTTQGHYLLAAGQALKQPVITLADGSDLLVATPHGAGHLYLFTAPLTAEYTDLVNQALFVPTLYNMALYSRPLSPAAYTLGSNDPIFLQDSYDPESTVECHSSLITHHSSFIPDIRRIGSRSALIPHGEFAKAGIYQLTQPLSHSATQSPPSEHLAFNYNRLESQLTFYNRSDLDDMVDDLDGVSVMRNSAKPLDQEIRARRNGTPLWRWCLLLALATLLGETILLNLGKPRKA